jgi:hypothetical protein
MEYFVAFHWSRDTEILMVIVFGINFDTPPAGGIEMALGVSLIFEL